MELDPVEVRVLGALVEKQLATPQYYPLTLNALVSACNQTSNRNPVVSYDEGTVQRALDSLRARKLTRTVHDRHGRATKYRHALDEELTLDQRQLAVLGVLLLRGPQTPGELRGRTERLASFESVGDVEAVLDGLAAGAVDPLAVRLERQPGQKEARYAHLLAPVPDATTVAPAATVVASTRAPAAPDGDGLAALRAEVAELRAEVAELRRLVERV